MRMWRFCGVLRSNQVTHQVIRSGRENDNSERPRIATNTRPDRCNLWDSFLKNLANGLGPFFIRIVTNWGFQKLVRYNLNRKSLHSNMIRYRSRGGYSTDAWVGRCGPGVQTLTLFKTQLSDFPILFETEFKIFRPYLRHLTQNHTLFKARMKYDYNTFLLYFNALAITIYLRHHGITI